MTLDRSVRIRSGALALRRIGNAWEIKPARPDGYDRPWARTRAASAASSSTPDPGATSTPKPKPSPRDASPKPADLEPDD